MQSIRIYEMPACRMASSGVGMLGEDRLNRFEAWFSSQGRGMFPRDFLQWTGEGFLWLYMVGEGAEVPPDIEVIDFPGGLYAVATDVDQQTDAEAMRAEMDRFLRESGLERDPSRAELGNVITSPRVRDILGYEQMDYYTPVRPRQA